MKSNLSDQINERVDDMFEDLGGCGCFQVLAYFGIAFGMSSPSWFVYEVGYLTQSTDDYLCTDAAGVTTSCTEK